MKPSELKQYRKSLNFSVSDLSKLLGCNTRYVRAMETEEFKPNGNPNKSHRKINKEVEYKINQILRDNNNE